MAIFDLHHPWVFVFGVLGNVISILVFLAPVPAFRRICKEKSTMGFQSVPYVVSLFSSMLWMYYAFIKKNAMLLISINSFGCVIETIYISIFIFYASKQARSQTVKLLVSLIGGLYTLIFLVTLFPFSGALRVQIVGWICVTVAVGVFAAPLSIVFQVVRTKSVEFMPFTLSFFLTLSAIMWFGYGLLQRDLCVAVPNVLGFFLGMIQMLLYGLYRNAKPAAELEKKVPEHVINMVVLGNSEQIHPVNSENSEDMIKKLEEEAAIQLPDEQVVEESHVSPPATPSPAANGRESEERGSSELAQVNLQLQQPLETPVLVVCAA
uniref:Bidirectional sugar transporter SWEET n=1 Tax=Petunia parodii TaxID=55890 RepID=A0A2Z6BEF1_PETPA|nr:bidirectional sugar transporter SWEET15 [Petunia axillaris subsp. parodii]